ncbi:MAG: hypothetical protein M3Q58_09245 [Bacteroidota bacterium]|nr:hypothetical protein [Bacteroidota bacterium]
MNILTLEELKETIELFSPIQSDFYAENCIVAMENNSHVSGCVLSVEGDKSEQFQIKWTKVFMKAGYKEEKKITEHAAETISFFLSKNFTEYTVIEEAKIGTGIDYWLGYDVKHAKYDAKNFIQARLEISGINKESPTNTLLKRVKEKKEQTKPSDTKKLPAYISVVEFSTPKAFFCKK